MLRLSKLVAGAFGALSVSLTAAPALAAGGAEHPKNVDFSFEGPLGRFDQAQLQRGFKVYREVCAACHSTNLVSFRHLAPTPPGMTLRIAGEVVAVDGQRVCFQVEAWDDVERICEGRHERCVIDTARFNARVARKSGEGTP